MASPKMMSPEERIAGEIRSGGVAYLRDAMRDGKAAKAIMAAMSDQGVRSALVECLRAEGRRLMDEHKRSGTSITEIPKMASPIGEMLTDSASRGRLRELMTSTGGREILDRMVSTTEGDFLTLGYLFNAPGGKQLVARMLLSSGGREAVAHILVAATFAAPDPYYTPKLPPYKPTAYGNRLRESLSTDSGAREVKAGLITKEGKRLLSDFFKQYETEAKAILREAISAPAGVERMKMIMTSDQGREFLGMIGGSLGRRIAGDDLWTTSGGRQLVRALLSSDDGMKAVFALVTGF